MIKKFQSIASEDRELIREQEGMEERLGEMRKGRRREDEKGSHCFFKSSGYDKLELKHQNFVFSSLYNALLKCHGVKQNAKICAIVEQNVIN